MSTNNRNVRLGIVYRGSIIKEEVLDRRIDVSVGIRPGSTVQISPKDYPDFPDNLELLLLDAGQYHLVVPTDPNARVGLRGASAADAKSIRGKRCIPVEGVAGGSLVVGDVTIMFQFVRADATPMATRDRMVLRIGLVYDERLISDRIFPETKLVTIGNNKADTVVLPIEDYQGPSIAFVNNKDGSATLKAPVNLKVRVAIDGTPMELKELQAKGKARQEGNEVLCHLPLGTRGRAIMGAHTVLFQVVKQSVTVPVMSNKSPLQRFAGVFFSDPTWSIAFLSAFLLVGAIVGQALVFQSTTGKYLGKQKSEEELAHNTYEVQVEQKEEEKPEEPEDDKKETVDVAPKEIRDKKPEKEDKRKEPDKKEASKAEAKPESVGKQVDPEEAKRNARATVTKNTIAGAFGGANGTTKMFAVGGEGEGEVVAKTFGGTGGGEEGENGPGGSQLKLASAGGGGGTIEKVKGGAKGFGDRKADVAAPTVKKEEVAVKIKLSSGGVEGGDGESRGEVAKVISRKNSAVQQCYERALRDNPEEGGKVKVSFTVGTAGTVTDVTVSGASGGFADCIKNKFSAIRGLPLLASPQSFNQSYVFSKN